MKKIIVILVIIIIHFGCIKDNFYSYSSSLFGDWSWFSTCGGIAGICYTPKSTNQKINLVFTSDSIFKKFVNDTLNTSGKFWVYKLVSTDTKDTTNVINYGSASQMFLIIHDTLYLDDFCCDRYGSGFKRIK